MSGRGVTILLRLVGPSPPKSPPAATRRSATGRSSGTSSASPSSGPSRWWPAEAPVTAGPPGHGFAKEYANCVRLNLAPLIGARHAVAGHAGGAVFRAKAPRASGRVRWLSAFSGAATLLALLASPWARSWSLCLWREGREVSLTEDDVDCPDEDRQAFLGHAALRLSATSVLGVACTARPALLTPICR